MPTEFSFDECFNRIRTGVLTATAGAVDPRTQVVLADILDIRQSSISDAKRRNTLPPEWLLKLQRAYGLNPDWIEFGTGGQFVIASDDPQDMVLGSEKERLLEAATVKAREQLLESMTLEEAKALILDLLPEGATVDVHFNQSWTKVAAAAPAHREQ
jgi:hypothetical protein